MEGQSMCEGSSESSSSSVGGASEEGGAAGWLTSTPQAPRRPLLQLNATSPRLQLTPYKYHGCRAIPEEKEDQENIDPSRRGPVEVFLATKHSSSLLSTTTTTSTTNSNTNSNSNLGSDSSPFAYPLIWESSHASATPSRGSPCDGQRNNTHDITNWKSPSDLSSTPSDGKGSRVGGSGKVRNRSGSSEVTSSCKVACHHGPSVTPSKSSLAHAVSNSSSVFLTPSSSMHSFRHGGENRSGQSQTPKQTQSVTLSTTQCVNPFEVGAESLYLSAVSPSLFQRVVSPSQNVGGGTFRWSIDQMAELFPVNIETSPFTQVEVIGDPEYEDQAQEAIDRFFSTHQSVVPSPWPDSNKSVSLVKKMCVQQAQASPSLPPVRSQSVWCQTELSLPPVLPPALEEALKPFCTFTQSQGWQGGGGGGGGEAEEAANLSNTTLRRKLLFSHEDATANTPKAASPQEESEPLISRRKSREGEEEEEEEEEGGLVWCTDVVCSKEASVMRHLTPTPPRLASPITPSTTTTTRRVIRRGPSPLLLSAGDVVSTPVSPDVSPIHAIDYNSDLEAAKRTPPSAETFGGSYYELQRTHCTYFSPSDAPQGTVLPPSCSPHPHKEKKKKGEEEEEKKMNVTESFCVQYSVQFSGPEQKSRSPVASTPSPDHRSLSNSGHFSSSPIRDVTESSPEVESPTRRFSASPPLSPILCRTTHMPSTRQTSLMLRKERKTTVEVTMMEESSDVGAPLQPLGTFPCSSSLYDVEMDSQPSLESHLEETGSQDTGYQTISSLLTSNFSSTNFPQPSPCDPLVESSVSNKHHVPPTSSSSSYSVTRSKEFKS